MIAEFLFVLFAGLCFGSFITCVSYRLPQDQDIVKKPSYCPSCNAKLGFKDLWPVLSWVTSKGKCRHCSKKISARYPFTEIVTASVFLLLYWRYGFTLQCALLAVFAVALLIMIVVDLEHYIIPDQVHFVLLPLGVVYHFVVGTSFASAASGFAIGLGLGLSLHYGYRWLRKKDGLGFGDVKFFAVAGLWLTTYPFVPFLFYSGLLGVLTGLVWRALKKGPVFPFGPALAIALFIIVAFPETGNYFWQLPKTLIST